MLKLAIIEKEVNLPKARMLLYWSRAAFVTLTGETRLSWNSSWFDLIWFIDLYSAVFIHWVFQTRWTWTKLTSAVHGRHRHCPYWKASWKICVLSFLRCVLSFFLRNSSCLRKCIFLAPWEGNSTALQIVRKDVTNCNFVWRRRELNCKSNCKWDNFLLNERSKGVERHEGEVLQSSLRHLWASACLGRAPESRTPPPLLNCKPLTSINTAWCIYLTPIHQTLSTARPGVQSIPDCQQLHTCHTALAGPYKTHCQLSPPGYLAAQTTTDWLPVPLRTRHQWHPGPCTKVGEFSRWIALSLGTTSVA